MPDSELIRTSFFLTRAQRERLQTVTASTGAPLSFQLRRALDLYFAQCSAGERTSPAKAYADTVESRA